MDDVKVGIDKWKLSVCQKLIVPMQISIFLYLSVFLAGHFTALKNTGIYSLLLFLLIVLLLDFQRIIFLVRNSGFQNIVIVFILVFTYACLISPNPSQSFILAWKPLGFMILAALGILYAFQEKTQFPRLAMILLIAGVVSYTPDIWLYLREYRAQAIFIPDYTKHRWYADAICLFFPFSLSWLFLAKNKALKSGVIFFVAIQIFLIFGSGARGLWLAIFVICLLWLWLVPASRKLLLKLLPVIILCVIAAVYLLPEHTVLGRIEQGFDTSRRIQSTWKPTLEMIMLHPLQGYGYGSFVYADEFNRLLPAHPEWGVAASMGAHNILLEMWFGMGLAGVVLLLYFVFIMCRSLLKIKQSYLPEQPEYLLMVSAFSAFVGYLLVRGMVETVYWQAFAPIIGVTAVLNMLLVSRQEKKVYDSST